MVKIRMLEEEESGDLKGNNPVTETFGIGIDTEGSNPITETLGISTHTENEDKDALIENMLPGKVTSLEIHNSGIGGEYKIGPVVERLGTLSIEPPVPVEMCTELTDMRSRLCDVKEGRIKNVGEFIDTAIGGAIRFLAQLTNQETSFARFIAKEEQIHEWIDQMEKLNNQREPPSLENIAEMLASVVSHMVICSSRRD